MYAIHRLLKNQQYSSFSLVDEENNIIHSPQKLIGLVSEYYKNFFNPSDIQCVNPWGNYQDALDNHITQYEVKAAMIRSNNGRAAGLDGLCMEFLNTEDIL